MTISIAVAYPLDCGARPQGRPRILLNLELPEEQTVSEVVRVGVDGSAAEERVQFDGIARVKVRLYDGVGDWLASNREMPLSFVAAFGPEKILRGPALNARDPYQPITLGSIRIDRRLLRESPAFRNALRQCWPTHSLQEIESLRFEPSGLYLVGDVVDGLLAGNATKAKWALRVAQPAAQRDQSTGEVLLPRRSTTDHHRWVLTPEEFRGPGDEPLVNSTSLLAAIRDRFARFTSASGTSMLDNIEFTARQAAEISLTRLHSGPAGQAIVFEAVASGTRVVIGGRKSGETQFLPDLVSGRLVRRAGSWQHDFTRFSAERPDPGDRIVRLSQYSRTAPGESDFEFEYPPESISSLNVPTIRTRARGTTQDAETPGPASVERAWLCVDNGWLGLDADTASARVAPGQAEPAKMGLVRISELLLDINQTSTTGRFDLELLPVATAQITGEQDSIVIKPHVSIELRTDTHELGAREILALTIERPLTFLTTPRVWLTDENRETGAIATSAQSDEGTQASEVIRDRSWVPSLAVRLESTGFADPAEEGQQATESRRGQLPQDFERILVDVLSDGEWVTQAAVESAGTNTSRPGPLEATVSWKQDDAEFEFSFAATPDSAVLWKRPDTLPLVRTVPLPTAEAPTVLLEDTRNLLPFRVRQDVSLLVSFPEEGLPEVRGADFEFGAEQSSVWVDAGPAGNQFMLPTLPGIECTVRPDTLDWRMRHAVPVLDESYREVTESQVSAQSHSEGLDLTRVDGAVSFEIGVPGTTLNATWLHDCSDAAARQVTAGDFDPFGRQPSVQVRLANGVNVVFSRTEAVAGLTADLTVMVTPGGGGQLADFDVSFAPAGTETSVEIRRNGQPMLQHVDADHGVTISDGRGMTRSEPVSSVTLVRDAATNQQRQRVTRSVSGDQSDHPMTLELVGIEVGPAGAHELDPRVQQWMLHDGSGDWPTLFDFPLRPVSLSLPAVDQVVVKAELLPAFPATRFPDSAVVETLDMTFSLNDSDLVLNSVAGGVHWTFAADETSDERPAIVELSADVVGLAENQLELQVRRLFISGPTGIVRLTDLLVGARLQRDQGGNPVLTIDAFEKDATLSTTHIAARVKLPEVSIPVHTTAPVPVPDISLLWLHKDDADGTGWTLEATTAGWTFSLEMPDADAPFTYGLRPVKLRKRQFVFEATARPITPSEHSFFTVNESTGFLAVSFATPTHVQNLSGELLFQLGTTFNQEPGQPADSVLARLSIEDSTPSLVLRATGTFGMANRIRFQTGGGQALTHSVRCFIDEQQPRIPAAALLLGTVNPDTDGSVQLGVVMEHSLTLNDDTTLTWQQAQSLRIHAWENYEDTYRPGNGADLPDNTMVLDASAVSVFQPDAEAPVSGKAVLADLRNSAANVAIAARQGSSLRLDKDAYIVRLPFAGVAREVDLHTITIDPTSEGLLVESIGAQQDTFSDVTLAPDQSGDDVVFFHRAAAADVLRERRIRLRLQPTDGQPALPAWSSGPGTSSVRLPATMDDLTHNLLPANGDETRLRAATVTRQYPVGAGPLSSWWARNGQVLADGSLLQFPHRLANLATISDADVETAEEVHVQLLDVRRGAFRVIASETLTSSVASLDGAIQAWAQTVLSTRSRGTTPVVLKDFSEFVLIAQGFEDLRDQVPDTSVSLSRHSTVSIDGRCRMPGRRLPASGGSARGALSRLNANPQRTVFATGARIAPTEETDRPVVAATHVQLAHVTADPATLGRLRHAERHPSDLAALTQWDEVAFEATVAPTSSGGTAAPFPDVDPASLGDVPPPALSATEDTVWSPLTHVIVWASRPGEVASTKWSAEMHAQPDLTDPREPTRTTTGLPTLATLRRPRAQAGRYEAVRLVHEPNAPERAVRTIFDGSFDVLTFPLEQTLGRTELPEDSGLVSALVAPQTYFASSRTLEAASTEPALLYQNTAEPVAAKRLEQPTTLFLAAGEDFDPESLTTPDGSVAMQTFVVVQKTGEEPPDQYPEGEEPPFEAGEHVVLGGRLRRPTEPLWTLRSVPRDGLDDLRIFVRSVPLEPEHIAMLIENPTGCEVLVLRYLLKEVDTGDNQWTLIAGDVAPVISTRVLNRDAAIRPPGMSVTLLSADPANNQSARSAGYGRLESEDFDPPEAQLLAEATDAITWVRYTTLNAIDRHVPPGNAWDVVLYGSGGELIPNQSV